MSLSRRRLLATMAPLAAAMACSSGDAVEELLAEFRDVDTSFAGGWNDLADESVVAFGVEVLATSPTSLDHARRRLEETPDLDACCDADAAADRFVVVAGWTVPETMAGLAAALAVRSGSR